MDNTLILKAKLPDHEFGITVNFPKLATMPLSKNYIDDILQVVTDAFEEQMDEVRRELYTKQEALLTALKEET